MTDELQYSNRYAWLNAAGWTITIRDDAGFAVVLVLGRGEES
jgi:hypothetical protein